MVPSWLWSTGEFIFLVLGVLRLAAWMRCECLFSSGACRYRCGVWGWQGLVSILLGVLCGVAPRAIAWLAGRIG